MKIKSFALCALLAISTSVSAQYDDPSFWRTSYHELDGGGWSTLWAEFNPGLLVYDKNGVDNQSVYGVSLGYSQAIPLIPDTYFCIEPGIGLQYSFYNESVTTTFDGYKGSSDLDFSMWSIKLPVNFLYRIRLGNSTSSLVPFAGLNLRYNFSAQIKTKYKMNGESLSETVDLFKSTDMGGSDNTWKRFQLGCQVGLKAILGDAFMIGASYGTDFIELAEKTRYQTATVTLGFCF